MLLSLKWLREFVPVEAGAQEVGDRLTMLGLELEDILHPYDPIKDIVVGHVHDEGAASRFLTTSPCARWTPVRAKC